MTVEREMLFERANRSLQYAEEELKRPKEDVVILTVCNSLITAIRDFLACYLASNRVAFTNDATISELKQLCAEINPIFEKLEFGDFECLRQEIKSGGTFCIDSHKLNECLEIALKTKEMVMGKAVKF